MQPGMPLVVTASFDPFETKWTKVVRELLSSIGQGGAPDGPNRQLGVSSLRASAAGIHHVSFVIPKSVFGQITVRNYSTNATQYDIIPT